MNTFFIIMFGVVGIALLITTFQVNNRRRMLRIQIAASLAWVVHFALLGAYTGAGINLMTALRNFLFDRFRKQRWIFWFAISAYIVAAIVTWQNWTSLLPLVGSILGTTAFWQINPRTIRFLCLFVGPCWFAYNLMNGSIPGMIGDSIATASVIVGIWRFDIVPLFRRRMPAVQEANVLASPVEKNT